MAGFMPELALLPPPLSRSQQYSSHRKRHTIAATAMAGSRTSSRDAAPRTKARDAQMRRSSASTSSSPSVDVRTNERRTSSQHSTPTPSSRGGRKSMLSPPPDAHISNNPSVNVSGTDTILPTSSRPGPLSTSFPSRSTSLLHRRRTSLRQLITGPSPPANDLVDVSSTPRVRNKLVKKKYSSQFELVSPLSGRNREAVVVGMPVRVNDGADGGVRVRVVDVKRSQRSLPRDVGKAAPEPGQSDPVQQTTTNTEDVEAGAEESTFEARKRWSRAPKLPELDFTSSGGAIQPPTEPPRTAEAATFCTRNANTDEEPDAKATNVSRRISHDQNEPVTREREVYDLLGQVSQNRAEDPTPRQALNSNAVAMVRQPQLSGKSHRVQSGSPYDLNYPLPCQSGTQGLRQDIGSSRAPHESLRHDISASVPYGRQMDRSARTYRVDIHAPSALAYHRLETDCMTLVLQAGGRLISDSRAGPYIYLGGFLYSLPAGIENPLVSTDRAAMTAPPSASKEGMLVPEVLEGSDGVGKPGSERMGEGYIVVQPWRPSLTLSTPPLAPETKAVSKTAESKASVILEHGTARSSAHTPSSKPAAPADGSANVLAQPPNLIQMLSENDPSPEEAERASVSSLHAHQSRNDEILALAHNTDTSFSLGFSPRPAAVGAVGADELSSQDPYIGQPVSPMPRQVRRKLQLVQQLRAQFGAEGKPEEPDGSSEQSAATERSAPLGQHEAKQIAIPDNDRQSEARAPDSTAVQDSISSIESGAAVEEDQHDNADTIPLSAFRPTTKSSFSIFHPYKISLAVTPTLTPKPSRSDTPFAVPSLSDPSIERPGEEVLDTAAAASTGASPSIEDVPSQVTTIQSTVTPPTITQATYPPALTAASSFSTIGSPTTVTAYIGDPFAKASSPLPQPSVPAPNLAAQSTTAKSPFSTPRSRLSALFSPLRHSQSKPAEQTTPTKDKAAQILGIGSSGQSSRFSVVRDGRVMEGETDSEGEEEEWESCVSDADFGGEA